MSAGYPLLLDVAGRAVLVVGAGPVGARRAIGLADAGALVTVVAPAVDDAVSGDDRIAVDAARVHDVRPRGDVVGACLHG